MKSIVSPMALPMPEIISLTSQTRSLTSVSFLLVFPLSSYDRPDIQRCGEGENKAGEEDTGRGELKLPVLSVVEICRADLHEEKDGEDHVTDRKDHIVDHGLNLSLAAFHVTFLIAPATSPAANAVTEKADTRTVTSRREKDSHGFFSRF